MCGICGKINFNQEPVSEKNIRGMMKIMKHRGPDDEGTFFDTGIGVGFVRLSIIDLSTAGHQPMFTEDGRYVIVFNGEIYNYRELRNELTGHGHSFKTGTDTEVLLASFLHWGEECLERLNGMWAFVIFDRKSREVFISRDRFGVKPFYYQLTNDYFAFSSEIPPLLSLLESKPTPDYHSIYDYLVYNRTDHSERTFFNEIKKLQHGCKISMSLDNLTSEANLYNFSSGSNKNFGGANSRLEVIRWYDLKGKVANTQGFSDPCEFGDLLRSSISLRLRSDVPVGVCLSGGIDSSSIVLLLLQGQELDVLKSFSAVYQTGERGDEKEFIDEIQNKSLEKNFVSPSGDSLFKDLDCFIRAHAEPIPGTSPYAQFRVMELAKGNVVVTLDGQGADESLAGYHYFFGIYFSQLLSQGRLFKLTKEMLSYFKKHKNLYGLKTMLFFLLSPGIKTATRIKTRSYINQDFAKRFTDDDLISKEFYGSKNLSDSLIDHFEYKLEHLLKWEDRNSMWFSIEARVPFLDYRLVERTLATRTDLILNKGITKVILREAMRNILPERIRLRRDKMGFETPEDKWFRTPQWEVFIMNLLNSPSFRERNLINADKAVELFNDHLKGSKNISKEIWKWVNLELWFRWFID
jgi:asparagine synthase (glutamine-hydrolysing)